MERVYKKKYTKKNQELFTKISQNNKKNDSQNSLKLPIQEQVTETPPLRKVCVLLDRLPVLPETVKGIGYKALLQNSNLKSSPESNNEKIENLEAQLSFSKTSTAEVNNVSSVKVSYISKISSEQSCDSHEIIIGDVKDDYVVVEGGKKRGSPQANKSTILDRRNMKSENLDCITTRRNLKKEPNQVDKSPEKSRASAILTNNSSSDILRSKDGGISRNTNEDNGILKMSVKPNRRGRPPKNKKKEIIIQETIVKKQAISVTEYKEETTLQNLKQMSNSHILYAENATVKDTGINLKPLPSIELQQTVEINEPKAKLNTPIPFSVGSTIVCPSKSEVNMVFNDSKNEIVIAENASLEIVNKQTDSKVPSDENDKKFIHLPVELKSEIKTPVKKKLVKKKVLKARRISAPPKHIIDSEIISQEMLFKSNTDPMATNNIETGLNLINSKQLEEITLKKMVGNEILQNSSVEIIDLSNEVEKALVETNEVEKALVETNEVEKALVETSSSQNLLSDKQNLEECDGSKLILSSEIRNVGEMNPQSSIDGLEPTGQLIVSPSKLFKGPKKIIKGGKKMLKKIRSPNKSLTTEKYSPDKSDTRSEEICNKVQLTSEKEQNDEKVESFERKMDGSQYITSSPKKIKTSSNLVIKSKNGDEPEAYQSATFNKNNVELIKSNELKKNKSHFNHTNQAVNVLDHKENRCNHSCEVITTNNSSLSESSNGKVNEETTTTSQSSLSIDKLVNNPLQLSNAFDSAESSNFNSNSINLNKKKDEILIVENPEASQVKLNNHSCKLGKVSTGILSPAKLILDDQKVVSSTIKEQQSEERSTITSSSIVPIYLISSKIHPPVFVAKNLSADDCEKNTDSSSQLTNKISFKEDHAFKIPNKTAPKARKFGVTIKSGTFLKPKLSEWNKFSHRSKLNLKKRETLFKHRHLREKILEKKLAAIKFKNLNSVISDTTKHRFNNYRTNLISQNKKSIQNPNSKSVSSSNELNSSESLLETDCNTQQTSRSKQFETCNLLHSSENGGATGFYANRSLELNSPCSDLNASNVNIEPRIKKLHLSQHSNSCPDNCREVIINKEVIANVEECELPQEHNHVKSTINNINNMDTNGTEESIELKNSNLQQTLRQQNLVTESESANFNSSEELSTHAAVAECSNTNSSIFKIGDQSKVAALEDGFSKNSNHDSNIITSDTKPTEKIVTSLSDFTKIETGSLISPNRVPGSSSQIKTDTSLSKLGCQTGLNNAVTDHISENKIINLDSRLTNAFLLPKGSKPLQSVLPEQHIASKLQAVSNEFIKSEVSFKNTTKDVRSHKTENIDCSSGRLKQSFKANISETTLTGKRRFPLTPGEKKIYGTKKNRDNINSSSSEKNINNIESDVLGDKNFKSPKNVTIDQSYVSKLRSSTSNKTSPDKNSLSQPNKLLSNSSLSLKNNLVEKINENTVLPTKLRNGLSAAEESDDELVQIASGKNLTEQVSECVSELQKLDNTIMQALSNYKRSIDNEEVNQELAAIIPKEGLSLKLHPDRPPQWFLKFITNFRKQELWRIHQTFKIHDHLIRVESAKLNVIEQLYEELNVNNRTEVEDEDSD